MSYTVYTIKNSKNSKCYIGMTDDFRKVTLTHLLNLYSETHPNTSLQKDFNEFGENVFKFTAVKKSIPSRKEAADIEMQEIKKAKDSGKTLYNFSREFGSPSHGKRMTGEKKRTVSFSLPQDIVDWLRIYAEKDGRSASSCLTSIITKALNLNSE